MSMSPPAEMREAGTEGRRAALHRLFRNDLAIAPDGTRTIHFTDVTEAAGISSRGYGMGCAVGDYDNDGDSDFFMTSFGPAFLYRNNGDGTFADVTAAAIPPDDRWSTSAAFVDYDRDGWLDLYICHYVNFSLRENKVCSSGMGGPGGLSGGVGGRDYCGPASFDPVQDVLLRNRGDGTFTDASDAAGITLASGSGLGVVCADFDADGWPDIYVANDGNANLLWMNQRDGTFRDTALEAGAAFDAAGRAEAGMGVTAEDFDDDGDIDLFITNLAGETNTLLVNLGGANFEDRTDEYRLGAVSRPFTGFGTRWIDVDLDGSLDLFIANGGVTIVEPSPADGYPYGMPDLLLVSSGPPGFRYENVTARLGAPEMAVAESSRGAAYGDIDNDGDTDILVTNGNGPARLYRNERNGADSSRWLGLRLIGVSSNRSAYGATVELVRAGRRTLRRVSADGSYCSASDARVIVSLVGDEASHAVTVRWPRGGIERFRGLAGGRYHELREGGGEAPP
jgi:hypothetical protein